MRLARALCCSLALGLLVGCPDGSAPAAAPTAPRKRASPAPTAAVSSGAGAPDDLGPPPPQTIAVEEVQVGARYRFLTQQAELEIEETWIVTGVEPGREVRYDLRSLTRVKGADPIESGPTPKVLLLSFEDVPPPPGPPPRAVGEETLEVDGQRFECTIYAQGETKRWISPRFPRTLRVDQDGQPFRRLVAIQPPAK